MHVCVTEAGGEYASSPGGWKGLVSHEADIKDSPLRMNQPSWALELFKSSECSYLMDHLSDPSCYFLLNTYYALDAEPASKPLLNAAMAYIWLVCVYIYT